MKSVILFVMLLAGIVACETPAPATGSETNTTADSIGGTTTPMSTDTSTGGTDTSTMKRDSM